MSGELLSMLRTFSRYEASVLLQMRDCQLEMNDLALRQNRPEAFERVRVHMEGLREDLRESRVALVRILCREVRRLLEEVGDGV
jgi:hypothetical protein